MLMVSQVLTKTALTQEDASAYNILFLGPTGSGKVTLVTISIIIIVNRKINLDQSAMQPKCKQGPRKCAQCDTGAAVHSGDGDDGADREYGDHVDHE